MRIDQRQEKRKDDEYLTNKNELFKKNNALLDELAKKYSSGGGELARAIAHGHLDFVLDILQSGGMVNNITPERFRGRILKCLCHRQGLSNVHSFYMENAPHEKEDDNAFHRDLFWIDVNQYRDKHCTGDAAADDSTISFLPNAWVRAMPPLVLEPGKYLIINRLSDQAWMFASEGLGITRGMRRDNLGDIFSHVREELSVEDKKHMLDRTNIYFKMCSDFQDIDPFENLKIEKTAVDPTPHKKNPWRTFPNESTREHNDNPRFKFYFFFGSIWMAYKPVKK